VVDRVLRKCRKPRSSPSQSDAFRKAFEEFTGTDKGDENEKTFLPGLLCASAAGHLYCVRTFLKLPGGGGLYKGVKVKLQGLKAKPELNGCIGTVQNFVQSSQRYSVTIDGDKGTFDLKFQNLARVLSTNTSNSPSKSTRSSSGKEKESELKEDEDVLEESTEEYLGAIEVDMSGRTALYHATLENRIEVCALI
jgi:hypothetical protein